MNSAPETGDDFVCRIVHAAIPALTHQLHASTAWLWMVVP